MAPRQHPGADPAAATAETRGRDIEVPRPLRWLVPVIVVYVILLVALPVQMGIQHEALAETIMKENPGLDPAWLQFSVVAAMIYSGGLHLIDVVLAIWFTVKIFRGRQWARIAFTVYLLIAVPASLISAAVGGMYIYYVIPSDIAHVVVLALLWLPASVRRFFAAHHAARSASRSRS